MRQWLRRPPPQQQPRRSPHRWRRRHRVLRESFRGQGGWAAGPLREQSCRLHSWKGSWNVGLAVLVTAILILIWSESLWIGNDFLSRVGCCSWSEIEIGPYSCCETDSATLNRTWTGFGTWNKICSGIAVGTWTDSWILSDSVIVLGFFGRRPHSCASRGLLSC